MVRESPGKRISSRAKKLSDALSAGRQRWFEELLKLAPQVQRMMEQRLFRETGWASFLDCMKHLGVGRKDAMTLVDLGRTSALAPELVAEAREGRIETEKLLAAAALVRSPEDGRRMLGLARRLSLPALRRYVRQEQLGPRGKPDGVVVRPLLLRLSSDARAMAGDLRARLSQLRERAIDWDAVYADAVQVALRRIKRGAAIGLRRHRVVLLDSVEDAARPLVCNGRVFGVEPSPWDILRTPEEELLLRRLAAQLGSPELEPEPTTDRRVLAYQLEQELREGLRRQGNWHYRAARALALIEEWELKSEMGFRTMEELGWGLLKIVASTTSELTACGRVCRRFAVLRRAFQAGEICWTGLARLAPHVNQRNVELLLEALRALNVDQARGLAGELKAEKEPGKQKRGRRPDRPAQRVEMQGADWLSFDRLKELMQERLERPVSEADVLEEALWQACESYEPPGFLWGSYCILIYRRGDVAWKKGAQGMIDVPLDELDTLPSVVVTRLADELAAAEEVEAARLAAGGPACSSKLCPPEDPADLRAYWRRTIPADERVPDPSDQLRRAIYLRSGGCCARPGCSSRLFLHVHHIVRRISGGGNHPSNLIAVCAACHGLVHRNGWVMVRRSAALREGNFARARSRPQPGVTPPGRPDTAPRTPGLPVGGD